MSTHRIGWHAAVAVLAVASIASLAAQQREQRAREVEQAERAFARTMADRDHAAFLTFVAEEAVFMSEKQTLRGRAAVGEGWKRYYEAREAPFSWEPAQVEVLDSGALAFSSGPVFDRAGKRIGTFHSVWRREADGRWRVVFDRGCPPCPPV
jgi:ketosteroid isomerase-like protein